MNQFIEFDRHFYNGGSAERVEGASEPEDGFEYNYSRRNDEYWSLITMEDTWKVARQIIDGRLVDWDFSYRLSNHRMDRELLSIATQHSAFIFRESCEFDDFCRGLWIQKYDYGHPRIAAGLLKLIFRGGAKPADIRKAWAACDIYSWDEETETRKWEDWVRRAYRTFLKTEGAVKYRWTWTGEENNYSGEAYSLSLVTRQIMSLVIWHDQIVVAHTANGFTIRYNEIEYDKPHLWDRTRHIGEHDPQTIEAWLEDFIWSAYGMEDQVRIELVSQKAEQTSGDVHSKTKTVTA
jgi:hypothetical protein